VSIPTVDSLYGIRVAGAKKLQLNGRSMAINIHFADGRVVTWMAFPAVFEQDALQQFFSELDVRAHSQLRGTELTDEERSQIEALSFRLLRQTGLIRNQSSDARLVYLERGTVRDGVSHATNRSHYTLRGEKWCV